MSNNVTAITIAGFTPAELKNMHPKRAAATRRYHASTAHLQKANLRRAISKAIGEPYDAEKEREHLDRFLAAGRAYVSGRSTFADDDAARRALDISDRLGVSAMIDPPRGSDAA